MFGFGPATRIYIAYGATDMRKNFNGLYGLVRDRRAFVKIHTCPLSGSQFRVAAIISVIESCRRLKIPVRNYLADVLPGLANAPVQCIAELTPAAWVAKHAIVWRIPSDLYTDRQNNYSSHFGLSSVHTPQMVVNEREQFVGSDRRALQAALTAESQRKQIMLHIDSAQLAQGSITFTYSASALPAKDSLQLVAVLVDDVDRSSVLRRENSGRELTHVAVARSLALLGALHEAEQRSVTPPLPASFHSNAGTGHHLVLFAQQNGDGAVMGTDTKPI